MKILYIILFIQIGWIFPLSAQKQDSIYIGTRHTLFSEILNEERKYGVYVPETKAGEKGKWKTIENIQINGIPLVPFGNLLIFAKVSK